jgi:putative ATP-binding cassette transporter
MRQTQSQRLLALAIGALSTLALVLTLGGISGAVPAYVAIAGLVLAAGMLVPLQIGAFLTFFIVFYGIGYLGLVALLFAQFALPETARIFIPPPLTAFTAAAFGILALLLALVPVVSRAFAIADPYFETDDRRSLHLPFFGAVTAPERWIAYLLLGTIIVINLAQVGISVRLNTFNRDFYDAIQNKNQAEFWRQLFVVWTPLVAVLITSNIIEFLISSAFKMRWRDWMTQRYLDRWLAGGAHYLLQFNGAKVDNPDQRIQEDITKFIGLYGAGGLTSNGSAASTYSLTIAMIQQISSLVAFSVILWGLSANLTLPGSETKIPGLLFWIALVYAGIGTLITHKIGRRLIPLFFKRETQEADFRFGMSRMREFAEPIALLKGETAEKSGRQSKFQEIKNNFFEIVHVKKWLDAFTSLYGVANSIIPIVISAPFFFTGQITLGVLTQIASAFGRVDGALAFFIDRYATVAEYKAVCDRLSGFESSVVSARQREAESGIGRPMVSATTLAIPALSLSLPDGRRIARVENLTFNKGERTLLVGPSGSGKSTLFRAIAGIWPFGAGKIHLPEGQSVMLLPQRPYIPIGSLRGAVSYPSVEGAHDDAAIRAALDAVRLPQLAGRLDEEANWSQILSGGEQQRLAVARALLAAPDWLFLDEATSALDEPLEDAVYAAIGDRLPGTSVVSIGHRSSLIDNHQRRIEMRPAGDGSFIIAEYPIPA